MMKYVILDACTVKDLERYVNERILKGWIPIGGIAVAGNDSGFVRTYVQAMTHDGQGSGYD